MNNQSITKEILKWYDNNKRILPWRKHLTKKQKEYFTLVSEIMLQQTQVKTVIPYFNNFIKFSLFIPIRFIISEFILNLEFLLI